MPASLRGSAWVSLLTLLATSSCGLGPRVIVVVELQTDLIPRIEFTEIRTTVGGEEARLPVGDLEFIRPARVAELRASPGTVNVRVQLIDQAGLVRAERLIIAQVRRDTGVVAFISAACRGVECPGETATCIRGMCQDARAICGGEPCEPGGDDCTGDDCELRFCPRGVCDDECDTDADCTSTDPCSDAECESSVCIGVPRPGACPVGFFCAIGIGCTDIPPGVLLDGGVPSDGAAPVDGGPEYCTTCMTNCGTLGFGVCDGGFPTGECIPPEEYCNGEDEDCDTAIDEDLGCDHEHPIVCDLGRRMIPGTMETEPNTADNFSGGGPGLLCAGAGCAGGPINCRTLRGGFDAHIHDVSLGVAVVVDDVPFPVTATVASASGHTHGARCGLGTSGIEVEGGFAFHRIRPMGDDEVPMPPGRYDQFCIPPVGDPATACYPSFGFCETD